MKTFRIAGYVVGRRLGLLLAVLLVGFAGAAGAVEETFDVLKIGTTTYTNVTVTTKAKTYIFILHSAGMANLKLTDLPPDLRVKLGYEVVEPAKTGNSAASVWARQTMGKIETPQVKIVEAQLQEKWRAYFPNGKPTLPPIDQKALLMVLGILLACHLFFSYCCKLICEKAGQKPGLLIWVPLLQQLELLRAAAMSRWWFLAYFVPLLNVVLVILWPFKIAKTRGKSAWVGLALLLPVINVFAFLYLAFSDGAPEKEQRVVDVMSLETA